MTSTSTEITPGTPQAQSLQDAIQKDLVARGYSTEGDEVMAEFVFVMLCNHKKPEQINGELSDLIGPDYDQDFTTKLFRTVKQYYPASKQAELYNGPAIEDVKPQIAPVETAPIPIEEDSRGSGRRGGGNRSNPFGVYANAIGGVKRPNDFGGREDRQTRQRTNTSNASPPLNAPTGPRNPQPTDGLPNAGPPKRERNIFDRVGAQAPPNTMPVMTPGGPAFLNPQNGMVIPADSIQRQIDSVTGNFDQNHNSRRGGRNNRGGNRQQNNQQEQQMMFAQQAGMPFFVPPGMMQGFPQGGFFAPPGSMPGMQPFQGFPQPNSPNGFQPGPPPSHLMNQFQPQPPFQQSSFPPQASAQNQVVPTKPLDEGLCKYATECKNAYCRFAHPSPAATKESGLVLSSEPCEKQLECTDPDCPNSHVSPQAKDPANSRPPPVNDTAGVPRSAQAPQPPAAQATSAAPSGKPCKFGSACTRPGCAFTHPWDTASSTPCRFGSGCTRPGCHFSHPPGHNPYKAGRGGYHTSSFSGKGGNRTAVFNTPASIAEKLKETEAEKTLLSERLKKFQVGGGEKIIPGQQAEDAKENEAQASTATEAAPVKGETKAEAA